MTTIKHIVGATVTDLGEFSVRRLLPSAMQASVGPWVFFDHMGPTVFPPGLGIDVRPHPHINLATVTYLFDGQIFHRDSLGSEQAIRSGAINLMIAGRGIVHSERELAEWRSQERALHGLQLWHALPEADEEVEPQFIHYAAQALPRAERDGIECRVLIGRALGVVSPVKTFADTLYAEASLRRSQRLIWDDSIAELAVYPIGGDLSINAERVEAQSLAVLDTSQGPIEFEALDDCRLVWIGGESLGHRTVWWNFVSSRPERIEQAKLDWREGRFDLIPGDDETFIPLPK